MDNWAQMEPEAVGFVHLSNGVEQHCYVPFGFRIALKNTHPSQASCQWPPTASCRQLCRDP